MSLIERFKSEIEKLESSKCQTLDEITINKLDLIRLETKLKSIREQLHDYSKCIKFLIESKDKLNVEKSNN